MATASQAKHKFCRRIGQCVWNDPKCPSVKRPYPAGQHGKTGRKKKLSGFGELMMEKQKLRAHYAISEKQLVIAFHKAKQGEGKTNEKLIRSIEQRLDAFVYRSGFAPTIFAAKQFITHGHIMVDGRKVNRPSYQMKEGQAVTVNAEKSPSIAEIIKKGNSTVPGYIMVELDTLKATLVRSPEASEIPVDVNVMSVVEFYAR